MKNKMKVTKLIKKSAVIFLSLIAVLAPVGVFADYTPDQLRIDGFTYEVKKEYADIGPYHLSYKADSSNDLHYPHWVGTDYFCNDNEENSERLNALNGVILFSDFPRAYNFGVSNYNGAYAGATSTNIVSLTVHFLLSDGRTIDETVSFQNTSDKWKMYLEVTDINGVSATFRPLKNNHYVIMKKGAGSNDRNLLELAAGNVTDAMKQGILDSSRASSTRLNGKNGVTFNKSLVWTDDFLKTLNSYTTYFTHDIDLSKEGLGTQTVIMKLDEVIDINCAGCLTYTVTDVLLANTYRVGLTKTSENYDPDRDPSSVGFSISGDVSKSASLNLSSDGSGSITGLLNIDPGTDTHVYTVKEDPIDKVTVSPADGYTITLKSQDIVKGIDDYKIWTGSVNGGPYLTGQTLQFSNSFPLNVAYQADTGGSITGITAETVAKNAPVSGSAYAPDAGYSFSYWTCDKDVTLDDGTVISAGGTISDSQLLQVRALSDMVFTAHFELLTFFANYDWTDAPDSAVLPTDNTAYHWHDQPPVDKTYTDETIIIGYNNGVPGKFAFSGWDASDEDLTENGMEGDVTFNGKWTFTQDTYTLSYNVAGDDEYGIPAGGNAPSTTTEIPWDGSVDPLEPVPETSWTTSDGTTDGVPGVWEFTPAWSGDTSYSDKLTGLSGIKENKDVYGKWTFTPYKYNVTYLVKEDETWGVPELYTVPSDTKAYSFKEKVSVAEDLASTQDYAVNTQSGERMPGKWSFNTWTTTDAEISDGSFSITKNSTLTGYWIFTPDEIPEEPEEPEEEPEENRIPKTGDTSGILLWLSLFGICGLALLTIGASTVRKK